ncbi:hypothetical protein [Pseudomonas sp. UMAB-08]|uniref:hypothetical protein n=1 Tax=Pseudomonas sp. UMAB-08 TaxID=1365375 RepID=UPI001C56E6A7|nr:hypothetical protein [Pseudomonas sp. UMAB-08]
MGQATWTVQNTRPFKAIMFLLVHLLVSACHQKQVDPAYVRGTHQNFCMALANQASEKKYGIPADQSVKVETKKTTVWIGASEFTFGVDDVFYLRNKYLAEPRKNENPEYVEGIWAGARYSVEELARHYPNVFNSGSSESAIFYLDISCSPGNKPGNLNKLRIFNKVEGADEKLGLLNYTYRNGVTSIPLNNAIKNPDGTPILIDCDSVNKTCSAAFSLEPDMLVKYSYPLSQRSNWLKIQRFIVNALTQAKE